MKNLYVRLSANVGEFRQQMAAAGATTRQFGRELETAATTSKQTFDRIGKAGVVAGGLIVAGLGAATVAAARFEQGMRNANSIMRQSEKELRATSAAVLDMSRRVPQSATTLASGLYDVASSGFQGAAGLKVLEASAIAATAGMTDTATAARAITGVLNAYGMGAEEAGRVSDVLFQAVNVGVLTFEELAQNVGDYTSTAAALNITVEETSAALATMTLAGINAAESSTALNRVMSSFIKPSDAMSAAIQQLGYESGEAMIRSLGLRDSVLAIDQVAGGSVAAIANMYGEVRAIKGALALAAAEGRNYTKSTEAMEDASDGAGAAMEAYNEQSKAFMVQLQQAKNSVGAVAIELGTTFLPMMKSGAQVVGNVADAIANLPGPVKTVTVVAMGLAGAIALTGGAAMIAVPKIVAYKAAVDTLGKSSPVAAAGLGKLSGAMGLLGKAGMIGAVVATAAAAIDYLGNVAVKHMADAPPAVSLLAKALEEMAAKGKPAGEVAKAFGADLKQMVADLKEAGKDDGAFGGIMAGFRGGGWADQLVGGLTGKNPAIEEAEQNLKALSDAFAELFATDATAATEAWDALAKEWEASGGDVQELKEALPGVSEGLENNSAAADAAKAEMEALKDEAAALGINLDDTSELLNMTAEDMEKLAGSTDPVIFAMLEAGRITKEQAEAMQRDLESFTDSVAQSMGEVTSPLGIYGRTVEDVNTRAKEAWDKAGKDADKFVERTTLSLDEYVGAMNDTVGRARAFAEGITRAIQMGYDPQLVAELLAAGPEQAGPVLETLLSDHSGRMVGIVNDSVASLRKVNEQVVEMARLTHLATTSTTDEMVSELGTAMAIAQQKAASGATATAEAIARALNIKLADVRRVAELYGIELAKMTQNPRAMMPGPGGRGMPVRNGGGPIPGYGDTDTVPAMLTPGEFVLRKSAVRAIGLSKLYALNSLNRGGVVRGVQHFAAGGQVSEAERARLDARDRARTVTDNAFDLGAYDYGDYLAELQRRLDGEQRFTEEWMAHHRRREAVVREFNDNLTALYNAQQDALDNQFSEERLGTEEYLRILRDRHARAVDLTGYWGNEATQLRQQIRDQENEQLERARTAEDVMYAEGRLSGEQYVEALRRRHEAIAEQYGYWSDEAHRVREEVRSVYDDMQRDAEEAAEAAARALEQVQGQLASVYERAMDRFRAQQAEYDRMVEQARNQVVGELSNVYESAQRRFRDQADALERALAERNAKLADRVQELRDSVAGPLRDTGDLLSTFGRGWFGSGDEIVAMLEHRIEAAERWDSALRDLQAGGLNSALVTRLAQAGPGALGLAEALQSLNPDVVNAAMAQLEAMGQSLADVFVEQEQAGIAAEVAAETPLPAMQTFNELLADEMAEWQRVNAARAEARAWAESMAHAYMPAINFQWQTFDQLLNEEVLAHTAAAEQRREAERWARDMTTNTQGLNRELRTLIDLLNEQAAAANAPKPSGGSGPRVNIVNGTLIDPSTGRPAYTGPGGEGGAGSRSAFGSQAGQAQAFVMPDGRTAWYLPGQHVQAGNQQALGIRSYDSGGYLPVGMSLAYNGTGRPEPVGHGIGGITVAEGAVQIAVDASGVRDVTGIAEAVGRTTGDALRKVLAAADQGVRG